MSSAGGLGGTNPFAASRHAAAASAIPMRDTSEESTEDTSNETSENTSNQASNDVSMAETTERETAAPSADVPPPPHGREPEPRVQMNTRIFADRDRQLREYQRRHGVTRQAVVDQMVDEYLTRRGLL